MAPTTTASNGTTSSHVGSPATATTATPTAAFDDHDAKDDAATSFEIAIADNLPNNVTAIDDSAEKAAPQVAVDPSVPSVHLSKTAFGLVYTGLALAVFLPALDQTIVSTLLQTLVAELGDEQLISWVGSSYMLTMAVSALIYGKLADIFGRKWTFVAAVLLFMLGSAICGAAKTMVNLIVGRAVAGLGGGAIMTSVIIVISDIVSMRDRGKYQGIIGAVFGLSSVIGPLAGGGLADHGAWRWGFLINLPVGGLVLVFVVVFLTLPHPAGCLTDKLRSVDYLGVALAAAATTCFLTPLQLGGSEWAWSAPQTIALFVASGVLLVAFVVVELLVASNPVVPPAVFMNRSVVAFSFMAFGVGGLMIGSIYYIAFYYQVDYGYSATDAGVNTIPLVAGLVVMSVASGQIVSRTGHYAVFPYISGAVGVAGTVAVSFLGPSSSVAERAVFLLILGLGAGSGVQIRAIGMQASVDPPKIAVASAVSQFLQTLGGAVGIAIAGAALNNKFTQNVAATPTLAALLAEPAFAFIGSTDFVTMRRFLSLESTQQAYPQAAEALDEMIDAFTSSFALAMRFLVLFAGIILVSAFFVKDYGLHHGKGK